MGETPESGPQGEWFSLDGVPMAARQAALEALVSASYLVVANHGLADAIVSREAVKTGHLDELVGALGRSTHQDSVLVARNYAEALSLLRGAYQTLGGVPPALDEEVPVIGSLEGGFEGMVAVLALRKARRASHANLRLAQCVQRLHQAICATSPVLATRYPELQPFETSRSDQVVNALGEWLGMPGGRLAFWSWDKRLFVVLVVLFPLLALLAMLALHALVTPAAHR